MGFNSAFKGLNTAGMNKLKKNYLQTFIWANRLKQTARSKYIVEKSGKMASTDKVKGIRREYGCTYMCI